MSRFEQWEKVDLQAGVQRFPVHGGFFTHDALGNRLGLIVSSNHAPATITGTIQGIAKLPPHTGNSIEKYEFDGVIDSSDSSRVYIDVPAEALYYPGQLTIAIRNNLDNARTVLATFTGWVDSTTDGTPGVPPSTLPDDIEDFIAELSVVRQEIDGALDEIEAKGEEVLASIPEDYTSLSQDVSDLKSALIDGDAPIDKQVNWINAYIDPTGRVRASSLSRAAVVPMRAGERVQIGTTNTNITIVGTTDNASIAVGDTITSILRTSGVSQFETFEYTAKEDLNITLCVNWSDYSLKFFGPSYAKTEISKMRSEVFAEETILLSDKSYSIVSGRALSASTTKVDVNFPAGTKYEFSVSDPSGCISKYYFYLNGSSNYQPYLPNTEYVQRTSGAVTTIAFYVESGYAVADGEISFQLYEVFENPESIEARVDSALSAVDDFSDYVPTGIADGYVVGHVVANGSFRVIGELITGIANRIRTSMIPIRTGDKIVIENGGFQHACGMWEGEPSTQTIRRNDNSFIATNETIISDYSGYIVIVFKKADNSNITPSEFDGAIKLYNTFAYRAFANPGSVQVPSYYETNDYISGKAARINALGKSGDDVFAFITDIHWEMNARNSPALISYLSDNCALHKMFNGGDVANASLLQVYKKYRKSVDGKVHHVAGNHDWFSPTNGKDLYYCMDSANNDQIGDAFGHYYYVDNVQQKIRYVVLNGFSREDSSSAITSAYSSDEIAWFGSEALSLPAPEWDVIVFTHFLRTTSVSITGGADIETAIATFNADVSHSGKILAVFQGHTHWDAVYHTTSGVPVITTTCDKWDLSNESELSQEQPGRVLGTISEQAFDVVVLNRAEQKFTCVRIGALAQNNVDKYRTDPNFEWIGTLQEREVSYA